MKKPERLVGFVEYENTKFPFEFRESSFLLSLYPPNEKVLSGLASPMRFFSSFKNNSKEHEWIKRIRIQGKTSERYEIVFDVQDSPSNYQGYISFQVNWFFIYENSMIDSITGFEIEGNVVNHFYPSGKAINAEIQYESNGYDIEKMSVCSTGYKIEQCGQYRIAKNVDAILKVASYATMHFGNPSNPIETTSEFRTEFSSPVGLDVLLDAYYYTRLFFKYITYRHNVGLGEVKVSLINEKGKDEFAGILVFPSDDKKEDSGKEKERIIKYNELSTKSAKLFIAIKNQAVGFQYYCDSIEGTTHYPSSRIIMILAAFEREYRNIFGQDCGRSDEYIETKQMVVDLIDRYEKLQHGKKRRYVNQLKNYVEKRDSSFEANVKKALTDCEAILSVFTRKRYEGTYSIVADGIAERMGIIRNGIAHSHIDLHFDAVHLSDIKIIEELIYAMRLRKIGLSDKECQKAINDLFGENFGF